MADIYLAKQPLTFKQEISMALTFNELAQAAPPRLAQTWVYRGILENGACSANQLFRPCVTEAETAYLFRMWAAIGGDVNQPCGALETDTPLMRAVAQSKVDLTQTLLELGAVPAHSIRDMARRRLQAARDEGRVNDECAALTILLSVSLCVSVAVPVAVPIAVPVPVTVCL